MTTLSATEKLAVLGRAARLLASANDFGQTLASTITACLPALGDFGFFDVVVEGSAADGVVRRTSRAHDDARVEAILAPTQWVRSDRTDLNLCALSSGESGLHPAIDDAWYRRIAVNDGHLEVLRALAFHSMLTVPMRYRGELVGALTLFFGRSPRAHDDDLRAFAEELAALAVPVVVNARLVEQRVKLLAAERNARTEAEVARAEAEQARREAEAANRAKDEFLAILGHELRNPLAPIVTALELMQARDQVAHRRERDVIQRQVTHLCRLVDDLLDVSRIVRGKVVLATQPTDILAVIDKAIEMTHPLFEQRRITLEQSVEACGVSGDPVRLAQVVANLLSNAAKFSPAGSHVILDARAVHDVVEIAVRDHGTGISPELLPRIFELFVQGPQPLDRRQGGLGLGLAIVANLVHLHGGSVTAESDGMGCGSTFRVRLPRRAGAPLAQPAHGLARARRRAKILVVDDNADAAELLAELLRSDGHDVVVELSAAAALHTASALRPELAILDLGLPDMDGFQLARALRERPELGELRLVALSGYGRDVDRDAARAAGFSHHLTKPVAADLLLGTLASLLDSHAPSAGHK